MVYSLQTVGVIFKTERDSFRVLDQNGQVRLVQPHQISMRRNSDRAIATDSEGHELRVQDNVKEIEGEVSPFLYPLIISQFKRFYRLVKAGCYTFTSHSSPSYITETSLKMAVYS
jgi:transcription elongation factor